MADAIDKSMVANVDAKGFVPDEVRNAFFRKLRMKSDNRSCFECNNRNPTWISLTYGIYLCLECSGEHRRKGVHLSFVRSVELDRFTPEQMVQMAVGGNGKAWEYFKQSGMGKTSDTGRTVDYNSKITLRYKQNMEAAAAELSKKLELRSKDEIVHAVSAPALVADTKEDEFGFDAPQAAAPAPAPAAAALQRGASAPAAGGYPKAPGASPTAAPPSTVKVIRAVTEETSAPPKPSGFVSKQQKAKALDFDFDFDDFEKEASKPAPAPAPKAAAPAATNGASAKPLFANLSESKPAATSSTAAAPDAAKFANKKGISSDDYFQDERNESAAGKMERESRYNKFAGAGAISSSAFFGDGAQQESRRPPSGDAFDWDDITGTGKDMAKKGAEMLSGLINKARS